MFVAHDGLLAIGEIQRVPDLVLSIKEVVDRDLGVERRLNVTARRNLRLRLGTR